MHKLLPGVLLLAIEPGVPAAPESAPEGVDIDVTINVSQAGEGEAESGEQEQASEPAQEQPESDEFLAPTEFRIFASGVNATSKGDVLFDEDAGKAVMAAFADHGMDKLPLDYGHAMLADGQNAETGKAAGWFGLELRDGELWAVDVKFTDVAAKALAAREYRFFSPAVELDDEGRAQRLINVALTNLPATKGLTPLVASQLTDGDDDMGEHSIALLSATGAATVPAAIAFVQDLKDKAVALAQRVNELEIQADVKAKQDIIDRLSREGKASPSTHDFLRSLSLSQLESYATCAPRVAPIESAPLALHQPSTILSDVESRITKLLAVKPDGYVQARADIAARGIPTASDEV